MQLQNLSGVPPLPDIFMCVECKIFPCFREYAVDCHNHYLTSHLGDSGMKKRPASRARHGISPAWSQHWSAPWNHFGRSMVLSLSFHFYYSTFWHSIVLELYILKVCFSIKMNIYQKFSNSALILASQMSLSFARFRCCIDLIMNRRYNGKVNWNNSWENTDYHLKYLRLCLLNVFTLKQLKFTFKNINC